MSVPLLHALGNFGAVYSAKLQKGRKKIEVAIKMVKNLEDPKDKLDFEREQNIMQRMAHPNIVQLYGLISDEGVMGACHVCFFNCSKLVDGASVHPIRR